MEIIKPTDPEVLALLKPAVRTPAGPGDPHAGHDIHADSAGIHAQGIEARKARSQAEIQGLSPAGNGRPFSNFGNSDEERFEAACEVVLAVVGSKAPEWAERIRVMRTERDFTAGQSCVSVFGYVLDRSLHLEVVPHPYLENGPLSLVQTTCEECQKSFKPNVPGQRFCSNDCGSKAWKRKLSREKAEAEKAEKARLKARGGMAVTA